MISYDEEKEILIGKIINVSANEDVMDGDKVDVKKVNPIVYDPTSHSYFTLGDKVGSAFSDGKKLIR
jgi:flavin reductase (DIM6/NTAB) family NADH-FMN oxidoreductase RutF